jgi:PKD repeat protein
MSSDFLRRWSAILVSGIVISACSAAEAVFQSGIAPPPAVTATALGQSSVRIEWTPGDVAELETYRIERRENLQGKFRTLAEVEPTTTVFFDTGLEPDAFYGYRIVALGRTGDPSRPSIVVGAHTAPRPGLRIVTALAGATPPAAGDPNGYQVRISGARDTTIAVGTTGETIVSPLPAGEYTMVLGDVAPTCTITGDTLRRVAVADTGMATRTVVSFNATCLDPTRGRIVVIATVAGDSVDPNGYQVHYAGILPGDTVPFLGNALLPGDGSSAAIFPALPPGSYEITLDDVQLPCAIDGPASGFVEVAPLSVDTLSFAVRCPDRDAGGSTDGPFTWRNTFAPQTAAPGQSVTLDIVVDLTADPAQDLGIAEAELTYDPAVLTFVSGTAPEPASMGNLTVNSSVPGTLQWLNFTTAPVPPKGTIAVARFTFSVANGATGRAFTRTRITALTNGTVTVGIDTLTRIIEDTVQIGSGGGGNQAPNAEANGPYSGTAGSPLSLTANGSTDSDGSIASYGWAFSDGTSATGAAPSKTFAAAGSYTATLTVTDDDGATDTDQATITVTAGGGGGNQVPVAQANGPYTGAPGAGVSFSSAGSSDPDGTIASYAWQFGDNSSSTEANPTKSYAAAGTYPVTLTITDNQGATSSAQTTATIASGGNGPTWNNTFLGFDAAFQAYPLQITLNLTQDLSQTPGPEAVQSFSVDSLVWDPAVFQYHSLTFGSGGGSFNTTEAVGGCKCKLSFSGSPSANTGIVNIARVLLKPIGPAGSSVTTKSSIGPVLSTPANGSFNYRGVLQVVEATITLP